MKEAVIFGVLNWGLGHATRSIPIIQSLQRLNYQVVICSDGDALVLLQKEFPLSTFEALPPYKVRYDHNSMLINIGRYGLGLLKTIYLEEQLLNSLVEKYSPAHIISDNRYGFHHPKVKSVIITHQLHIPTVYSWQGKMASHFLGHYIEKFDECWIPDVSEKYNLCGKLAHDVTLSIPIHYIGYLSRLIKQDLPLKYDIAFILSGPEPQRTILEDLLLQQIQNTDASYILVRGTAAVDNNNSTTDNLAVVDLADSVSLSSIISQSGMVLSRAGYTTIMDLVAMRKPAILIPTPGQPEQEYLAEHLSDLFASFIFVKQADLDLSKLNIKKKEWVDRGNFRSWSDEKLAELLD